MYVSRLRMVNFRNYDDETIYFSDGINIIYGMNAQGKTNILEAIYLCAAARSHRTGKDFEMVRFGEDFFRISLSLEKKGIPLEIEAFYQKNERKHFRINQVPLEKMGDLMGNLNATIFSPEDLMMIKEGPLERRKFMNIAISQIYRSYFYDLLQYSKVVQQRNNLLKSIGAGSNPDDTLSVWNQQLAMLGSRIIRSRVKFFEEIGPYLEEIHARITNKKEKLKINFLPSFSIPAGSTENDIRELFLKNIKQNEKKEILKGCTLIGPHRDDFQLLVNGVDVRFYGSQGQQRTTVLSLKLAELKYLAAETGDSPILLLDDVLSELDSERQDYLLKNIDGIQTFVTCTDSGLLNNASFPVGTINMVKNGKTYKEK